MFAINYSGKVSVTVYDGTLFPTFHVGESADIAPGTLENGFYAPIQDLENEPIAIYALYNNVAYENLVLNTVENLPMGIKASNVNDYTLYFANKVGTIRIYDKVAGQEIDLTNPYPFSITDAQKGTYINDRFYINYNAASFTYSLTTNAYGWASYSNDVEDVVATVPTGLKIYKGAIAGDVLNLSEMNYVAANEGVIVYGAPNTKYYFAAGSGSSDYSGNSLKPSSAWTSNTGNIYVLHDEALYQYTGSDMPANKAYLPLPGGASSAPKHIRMVIAGTTAVDNVEAETVKAEKFVEDGQVYIRRGNEVYNLQGQKVNF